MLLPENVDVSSSIYYCAFGHPFNRYVARNVKKEHQHYFSSRCFLSCFHCVLQSVVLPYQWRLLTGWYVIMAPQFIACNYEVEKHIAIFSKASEILFASDSGHSTWFSCQCMWYPVSTYFSIIQFFVMIFSTAPYAAFALYKTSDNFAFQLHWMIVSTLFSSVLSATETDLSEWPSSMIFSQPLLNFLYHFLHMLNADCGFTLNILDSSISFNRWKVCSVL